MDDTPFSLKTDTELLMEAMSVELYETERVRVAATNMYNYSRLALLTFFVMGIGVFLLENFQFLRFVTVFLFVFSLIFTLLSSESLRKYGLVFKEKIVSSLLKIGYPELRYTTSGAISESFVVKASRYNSYDGIRIGEVKDLIDGRISGIPIQLTVIENVFASKNISQELNEAEYVGKVFSGLFMLIDLGQHDLKVIQQATASAAFKIAIDKLDAFWGSFPQVTAKHGYCIVDISLVKGRKFLQAPNKEKLYNPEYFAKLRDELDLLLKLPEILKIEINSR